MNFVIYQFQPLILNIFVEVRISDVMGKEPLDNQNIKKFKKLVEFYRDDIVRKWVDFFVYNKAIESEIITKKI